MAQPPATPRWSTLGLLGAVVLGVHLWLLAGGWPDASEDTVKAQQAPVPSTRSAPPSASPPAATSPVPVQPVTVSSVRWVAPEPVQTAAAAAAQTAKPARAAKSVKPAQAPTRTKAEPPSTNQAPPATPAVASTAPAAPAEPPTAPEAQATATPPAVGPAAPASGSSTPNQPTNTAEAPPQGPPPPAAGVPTPALPPARVPGSTQLAFDVNGTIKGLNYNAQATLDWTVDNGRFDARMVVRLPLVGSRVQTSTGRVDASTGLLPERFADKARQERATHFDHAQQRIRFSVNTPETALQPGAQDRLSLFLQLAARFNAAPGSLQAGQVIELQVAGPNDAEPWRFRVGDEETLNLPAGALRTRYLVREPRQPRDSQVELWLAPGLEHLPVRIRVVQHNGDQIDQQLSRLP